MFIKKTISLVSLLLIAFVMIFSASLTLPQKAEAQNIGSLKNVVTAGFSFKKDLMLGDTDPDVKQLQQVLNADVDTTIALSGAGSSGNETTYFGASVKAAVIKFQEKYRESILTPNGLTRGTGSVGKATRTKLNLLIGVMTTSNSSGLPASRATVAYVAPTVVAQPQDQGINVCQFVNLLLNLGIISPDKGSAALAAVNCSVVSAARPTVDLKINGSDGPISVANNSNITISWTSANVSACSDGSNNIAISGSTNTILNTSRGFTINCRGTDGTTVSDYVAANVTGQNPAPNVDPNDIPKILFVQGVAGYTTMRIEATTDRPTKMYVTYRTNSSDSKIAAYESLLTTRKQIVTGLIASTTYYVRLNLVTANGAGITSDEVQVITSNNPSDDDYSDIDSGTASSTDSGADVKQRVLYSTDGNGVMSIQGSDSLKTNSKITIEAWVKPTSWRASNGMSGTADSVIISKGNVGKNIDYTLSLDKGKLVYSNNDASIWTCSSTVPLNTWSHVAVSVDELAQTLSMYVNGIQIGSSTAMVASSTASTTNSTASTTPKLLCEGPRGVFKKGSKINRMSSITNEVGALYSQATSSSSAFGSNSSTGNTASYSAATDPFMQAALSALSGSGLSSAAAAPTSNVYVGNMYPRYCGASSADSNGFIGSIDDVKMWNTTRTPAQVKTDMKSSTKNANGLIGYFTFDDGTPSDASSFSNSGDLKGSFEIVDDATATSTIVAADYPATSMMIQEPCEEYPVAPPEPDEPDYGVQFAGQIMAVQKCSEKPAWRVIIKACPGQKAVTMLKPNPEASAIETRDVGYYNNDAGLIAVNIPMNLSKPANKTMVFAGVANGAYDEVCQKTVADADLAKVSEGTIDVSSGALTLTSFTYDNQSVKSIGRAKSWSLGKRGANTCIGVGKHRGGFIRNWF